MLPRAKTGLSKQSLRQDSCVILQLMQRYRQQHQTNQCTNMHLRKLPTLSSSNTFLLSRHCTTPYRPIFTPLTSPMGESSPLPPYIVINENKVYDNVFAQSPLSDRNTYSVLARCFPYHSQIPKNKIDFFASSTLSY